MEQVTKAVQGTLSVMGEPGFGLKHAVYKHKKTRSLTGSTSEEEIKRLQDLNTKNEQKIQELLSKLENLQQVNQQLEQKCKHLTDKTSNVSLSVPSTTAATDDGSKKKKRASFKEDHLIKEEIPIKEDNPIEEDNSSKEDDPTPPPVVPPPLPSNTNGSDNKEDWEQNLESLVERKKSAPGLGTMLRQKRPNLNKQVAPTVRRKNKKPSENQLTSTFATAIASRRQALQEKSPDSEGEDSQGEWED